MPTRSAPTGRRPSSAFQADDAGAPNSSWSWVGTFLNARAGTIYAGSSQIQRNIIGEMVLGLPKEPQALADMRSGVGHSLNAVGWSSALHGVGRSGHPRTVVDGRASVPRRRCRAGWWRRRPFLPVPSRATTSASGS